MATDETTGRPSGPNPVRIGDAERQRMTDLLQRHMGAGRLDMPEYERRVEHATGAVYEEDLAGLLDDLPPLDEDGEPAGRGHDRRDDGWDRSDRWPPRPSGRGRPPRWPGVPFAFPFLAFGAIALVIATHGWILLPLAFLAFARGGGCGRWQDRRGWMEDARRHRHDAHGTGRERGGHDHAGGPRWPGGYDPFDADDQRV